MEQLPRRSWHSVRACACDCFGHPLWAPAVCGPSQRSVPCAAAYSLNRPQVLKLCVTGLALVLVQVGWDTVDWASAPAIQEPPVVSAICDPGPDTVVSASDGEVTGGYEACCYCFCGVGVVHVCCVCMQAWACRAARLCSFHRLTGMHFTSSQHLLPALCIAQALLCTSNRGWPIPSICPVHSLVACSARLRMERWRPRHRAC